MKNHRPTSTNTYKTFSASGDCIHITGELPATVEIEDKAASVKIYIQDTTFWVLILLSHWVFWTYHSVLFVMQFPDPQLRVPLQAD